MRINHNSIKFVLVILVLLHPYAQAAAITGPELWDKVIGYHDPDGKWAKIYFCCCAVGAVSMFRNQ